MLNVTELKVDGFERVVRGVDETTGLDAVIAIHNTNLGPALGGCRAYDYESFDAQLADNLNLARGMTYKSALAGLKLGGGKSTIFGAVNEEKLKSFAELLNFVNKDTVQYFAAGDVGTTTADLAFLKTMTSFVNGDTGTDSGVATAYGVFNAMKGALKYSGESVADQVVSVNGFGKVGKRLTNFLVEAGARVIVSDIVRPDFELQPGRLGYGIAGLSHQDGTVFSPCAVGGAITPYVVETMPDAQIICGGANNQIADPSVYDLIAKKDILYVPDFVANAGGVIIVNTIGEVMEDLEYDDPRVKSRLEDISNVVYNILDRADRENKPTEVVANIMAEEIFNA